ncbi:MAG: CHRD domain-containing protein [Acidobacteria bacterium]|nr:CHRD domain-containing protein [Acidobacteriota bacterium]
MKRTAGFVATLCALLLLALTSTTHAETVSASVLLTPGAEITPPVPPPAGASGMVVVTINITRDAAGAITAATMNFRGTFSFPSSVSVVGFHIHEGAVTVNGGIIWDSGINTGSAIFFSGGSGFIDLNVGNVNLARLPDLLANPSRFYVNLHTTVNPAGAIRGQIHKWIETLGATVNLNTTEEITTVPLPPGANGVGTFTMNPIRRPTTGEIIGGTFRFTVTADLPPNSTLSGLHIHLGNAGVNGGVVLDSRVSPASGFVLTTGRLTITAFNQVITPAQLTAFRGAIDNPPAYYMNLHTTANPAGVIRSQLRTIGSQPVIHATNATFLATGNTDAPITIWTSGTNYAGSVYVNGQLVPSLISGVTSLFEAMIPAALRSSAGVLHVQVADSAGVRSAPWTIVVGAQASVNTVAATTVDGARFGNLLAPEAIAAAFGTKLATQTASAPTTSTVLPNALGGSTLYVNGVAAGVLYVSDQQANYQIPAETMVGPAQLVVVASDGTVSRGTVNLATSIPAIFTRRGDGTGAPSGNASTDGQNFTIPISNPDGTPVPIDAGNFVSLFGTGFRFGGTMSISIGGTNVTPSFFGPQGTFVGLDQANLQIPASLAGRGAVNLIITVDNKASNMGSLNIK